MNNPCAVTQDLIAHEGEVDRKDALESAAEDKEIECRETLHRMEAWEFLKRFGAFRVSCMRVDGSTVMDGVYDLGEREFPEIFRLTESDPLEFARRMADLKGRAIAETLESMDFEEIVTLEAESARDDAI